MKSIVLIKPDGSDQQAISEAELSPEKQLIGLSWSPDSKQIAIITDLHQKICIFGIEDRTIKFIYPNPEGQITITTSGVNSLCWSKDGNRIAFMRKKSIISSDWDIWTIDSDGNDMEQIIESPAFEGYPAFADASYGILPKKTMKAEAWGMIKRNLYQ